MSHSPPSSSDATKLTNSRSHLSPSHKRCLREQRKQPCANEKVGKKPTSSFKTTNACTARMHVEVKGHKKTEMGACGAKIEETRTVRTRACEGSRAGTCCAGHLNGLPSCMTLQRNFPKSTVEFMVVSCIRERARFLSRSDSAERLVESVAVELPGWCGLKLEHSDCRLHSLLRCSMLHRGVLVCSLTNRRYRPPTSPTISHSSPVSLPARKYSLTA